MAAAVLARRDPDPATGALWLFGALLLATTPVYGWYALPLIALAVLVGRPEWLVVAFGSAVAYAVASNRPVPALVYAAVTVALAVLLWRRTGHRAEHEVDGGPPARHTAPADAAAGRPVSG